MSSAVPTIAVIGGGPAGSMFGASFLGAWRSASRVVLFEERRGWEKPCGGGLTWKALDRYPFLADCASGAHTVREMEVAVPEGRRIRFPLRNPVAVYSRRNLNQLLLVRAKLAGAEVIEDRITRLIPLERGWKLEGRGRTYEADFVVVAAGARTRLRGALAGYFPLQDFMLTFGYYVPRKESLLRVECFRDFDGYAWSFPRADHLSVGICGRAGGFTMAQLKQMLHVFMSKHGYAAEGAAIFAHLLPSLSMQSWSGLNLAGPGWAFAGDAGGLVDPITGEGIYFAMRSGELLAQSIVEARDSGASELSAPGYEEKVRNEFGYMLMRGARASSYFYHANFLGDAVPVRLVQLALRSPTFMDLLQDLIEGRQTYDGLKGRVMRAFPRAAWEIILGRNGGAVAGGRVS